MCRYDRSRRSRRCGAAAASRSTTTGSSGRPRRSFPALTASPPAPPGSGTLVAAAKKPKAERAARARVGWAVTGVGFRAATVERAHELGVLGWVRNDDGEVIVHAE